MTRPGRDDRDDRPRRRSRSRSPHRDRARDRDRGGRSGGGRGGGGRERMRERTPDRRDDHYRGARRDDRDRDRDERRRSRDRYGDRLRSPDRRRNRSRDEDRAHRRREDSRDTGARAPREGTADLNRRRDIASRTPISENGRVDGKDIRSPRAPPDAKPEVDKKAEQRAKLEAWKKSKESAQKQEGGASTQKEVKKTSDDAGPTAASPHLSSGTATPASPMPAPYAGKFDHKAIAKKAAARSHEIAQPVLGAVTEAQKMAGPVKEAPLASKLPTNRAKTSAFGFAKQNPGGDDKLPFKRKLDLDEEEHTKRKLTKLPDLPPIAADDVPYADLDDDSEGDNFAENEEEAAAVARALHEKRRAKVDDAQNEMDTSGGGESKDPEPLANGAELVKESKPSQSNPAPEKMDVDGGEKVDSLDAYMASMTKTAEAPTRLAPKSNRNQLKEPEAFHSDDEYGFEASDDDGAKKLLANVNKRKKKDIPSVDYSTLDLAPIRKNFWVEPMELSQLSEADLADLRLELDGIKVKGENVPKPVQKWAHCGLSRTTMDIIEAADYEKPTPIQMQALPTIMSGRDVIGVAKTGSGKTMAFLLPMFRHIMDQPRVRDNDGPVGLIMTPTRELAVQIHRDCKPFLKSMGMRAMCAYGGAPIRDQIAELKRGAEIVVGTPGRMIDLLAANQGRVTNLRRVTYIVLDEADRMFDMGFEPQVMKIFANMRPDKQTILFSATMPRIVDSLIKKVLKNPVEITVGGRSVVAKEIEQIVEVREESTKFIRVLELLGNLYENDEDHRTLIFVERQEKADDLLKQIMMKGYPCMSIHGGKDQVDRDSTIYDFKKGVCPILVATSVAARGLDVKQLKLVINFDAPNHLEDYVHRAGRTGRAGNTGKAVTFVTPEQENCAPGIAKALEQSGQPVPEDLEKLRQAHREKVKSGKAKDTSGFGGKGLDRLDAEREAARVRERKTHRAEGEEVEEEKNDEEKKKEDDAKVEKALSAIQKATSSVQTRAVEDTEVPLGVVKNGPAPGSDKNKNPLDKVSSAITAINSRLGKAGQLRAGQPIDNKGPDAGAFHATLEINDFPQKARWAVTNRSNMVKILDATGTSITTKGNFYPPGKEVPEGAEPKVYILIEGDTEVMVSSALTELTRLLREGTIAAADAEGRAPASGRYTVT